MRTQRYAIAALALAASTALMSCSSDNSTPSNNSGAPVVADSTVALNTLPTADTNQVGSTLP